MRRPQRVGVAGEPTDLGAVRAGAVCGGIRSGPPRGSRGASRRRAVRHPGARAGRHRDRGGADRLRHAAGREKATLARDTIFAAVMIICNGVVGMCLLVGRRAPPRAEHSASRAPSARSPHWRRSPRCRWCCPHFTTATRGAGLQHAAARLRRRRLARAVWHLRLRADRASPRLFPAGEDASDDARAAALERGRWASFGLLLVSLVAVVRLAKMLSPTIERGLAAVGAPKARGRHRDRDCWCCCPRPWAPCARRAPTGCRPA